MMVGNLVMSLAPPACAASRSTAAMTPGTRNATWTNQVSSTSPRRDSPRARTGQNDTGCVGAAGAGPGGTVPGGT